MHDDYALRDLPADLSDDDPTWRTWFEAVRLGFHEETGNDAQLARFREMIREDGWLRRGVFTDRVGLSADVPVATYASTAKLVNVGHGRRIPCHYISDITVRASDRRRGLLRQLMTADLTAARNAGRPLAALTTSEGSIYGRFGFDIALRYAAVEVDTRRWRLRTPAIGRVELVQPQELAPHLDAIWGQADRTQRGAFEHLAFHRAFTTGTDPESWEPSPKTRALLHVGEDGTPDGYAVYRFESWEPEPKVSVREIVGITPAAEIALWDGLASLDLVTTFHYGKARIENPAHHVLADPRAISVKGVEDSMWLRILDPVAALTARGWDAEGETVLSIIDPLEFASGTYRVVVREGDADVQRDDDAEAELTIGVDALSAAYFGDASIGALAAAGRVTGSDEAVRRADRLFAVADPGFTSVGF